jgi:hypothetical protein
VTPINVLETNVCVRPEFWQSCSVTTAPETRWLTIPDLVDILGIGVSKVRRLIEDKHLLAVKVDGAWKVPASFLRDDEPLVELRGTLLVLQDSGYSDDEAMHWLLTEEESLGVAPIDALRSGRKAEVRRVAQALGF